MQIMTKDGWRDLEPKNITPPQHVKSLCEENGIDVDFPGERLFCNAIAEFLKPKGQSKLTSYDDLVALKTVKSWKAWDAYKAQYGFLLKRLGSWEQEPMQTEKVAA